MTRKKRLTFAVIGFLVFLSFLIRELLQPEKSKAWHVSGLYLYIVGIAVFFIYFLIAYRRNKER